MRLILVRHGETDWNTARRVQGRTDTALNARGLLQAEAAAEYLSGRGISAVYAGPLMRAAETANIIAAKAGVKTLTTLEGLTEINFGGWEGKTNDELTLEFPRHWKDWNWVLHPELCREIGAESAQEILERALDSLRIIMKENPADATVAAVSHTMPIKLLTAHCVGLPVERIRWLRADNCGSSVLQFEADGCVTLRCWNDTSYLGGLL